jgi:RNA 3'-terminal phosphate cyclase (ATP)
MGEGGGQILRSSLALSALTGQPVTLENIRAARRKPGLMRQHLTAVRAAAEVCGAQLSGDELGGRRLIFRPGRVEAGDYRFSIGTAGSTTLVLQTVLPPLLRANGDSTVVVEGGTHNSKAPPFEFLDTTFGGVLRAMGADVEFTLGRHGFYPAGGGSITARIRGRRPLWPLALTDTRDVESISARALLAGVPQHVGLRELATLREKLTISGESAQRVPSDGPGNVVMATVRRPDVSTVFTAYGERGVRAERVAEQVVSQVRRYLTAQVPVGEFLADQLLLPCFIAGGGEFRTRAPSLHTTTNADVLQQFTDARVRFHPDGDTTVVSLS